MLKSLLSLVLLSFAFAASAELAPWLPEPAKIKRANVITISDIPNGPSRYITASKVTRSLNGIWKISKLETARKPFEDNADIKKGFQLSNFNDSKWDKIAVPLNWYKKYPKKQTQSVPYVKGWYRTDFKLTSSDLEHRRIILKFGVIGYEALLFLNEKEIGRHKGDFTSFEIDATKAAKIGKNVLSIRVFTDQGTRGGLSNVTHAYGSQWAINNIKGGIWQSVFLSLEPEIRIGKILITPRVTKKLIEVDYTIINHTGKKLKTKLFAQITPAIRIDADKISGHMKLSLKLNPGVNTGTFKVYLPNAHFWSVDDPYLYFLTLHIKENGKVISSDSVRFGYRNFKTKNGKFYLNGKEIYLFGQNIPSVNYGGHGRSDSEEAKLFEKKIRLFRELGYVIVRNAHMPILPKMLEIADEYGLMVYYEWAWSFTTSLDIKSFRKNNIAEVREFVDAAYNHPSVVMWVMGNEIRHQGKPEIVKLLNEQVQLVRKLDKSGRPVNTFSGAGGWMNYGENKLETDLHDMHNYTGIYNPWTTMMDTFKNQYEGELRIYGEKKRLSRPLISWENVGYSWGAYVDSKFKRGNVKQYATYMGKPTSWGSPNGVGFTGSVPLFKALGHNFGPWAQTLYGHRIFELFRLNPNFSGFAPWFSPIPASTLWTQLIYPSLYSNNFLFPRNLFIGDKSEWNLELVNDGDESYRNFTLLLSVIDNKNKETQIGMVSVPELKAHSRFSSKYMLAIPKSLSVGNCQLRLSVIADKQLIARNYYDIYLQKRSILTRKIIPSRSVYVMDTKAPKNVAELTSILKNFGIDFKLVDSVKKIKNPGLLIVPAEIFEEHKLSLNTPSIVHFLRDMGGTLLVLEQKNLKSRFPGNQMLMPHSSTFVDQVSPEHPIFSGLDYQNFDTWNTSDHGFLIYASFIPYIHNAIAIKGPTFSHTNLGNAIVEAIDGKGRLILSQLAATNNRKSDSVAATYLYNLLNYAVGSSYWENALLLEESEQEYVVKDEQLSVIDLKPYANVPFKDKTNNDGQGGWTDQGKNDFRMMPIGRQKAAGITFSIIDPTQNNEKSCLVLRGTKRPRFPAAIKGIQVGRRLSRIFFLHTAGWGGAGFAGAYRIHYADGTSTDYRIMGRDNIGDWWQMGALPNAKVGIVRKNLLDHEVGTYVASWDNPRLKTIIKSIDFLSVQAVSGNDINWMPVDTPIPILIAATGETLNDRAVNLLGDAFRQATKSKEIGSSLEGKVKIIKNGNNTKLLVQFPACRGKDVPAVRIAFDPSKIGKNYTYLSCWIKSSENGIVQFVLAEKNWKGTYSGDISIRGNGQWRKYRLMFNRNLLKWGSICQDNLRGELFLFARSKRTLGAPRPELSFEIKDIMFE